MPRVGRAKKSVDSSSPCDLVYITSYKLNHYKECLFTPDILRVNPPGRCTFGQPLTHHLMAPDPLPPT